MRHDTYELLPLSGEEAREDDILSSNAHQKPTISRPTLPIAVATSLIICFIILTIAAIVSKGGKKPLNLHGPSSSSFSIGVANNDYILSPDWKYEAAPTTREYQWTIRDTEHNPDGVYRPMILINDQFPGPLIRCNEGDRIVVHVRNEATNATSIHWHGIYQNGSNWMDGTVGVNQCPISPGVSLTYNFTINGQTGTYWYHAHHSVEGSDGLIGPLIVHGRNERKLQQLEYATDRIVIVQDHYYDLGSTLLMKYLEPDRENIEPVPDGALINGRAVRNCDTVAPWRTCDNSSLKIEVFALEAGKNHRLRFINAGAFAEFQVQIDEHDFAVTEVDGTDVSAFNNVRFHRMNILPAQRYSIILSSNISSTSDSFWMRARLVTHCFREENPYLQEEVLAIVQYVSQNPPPSSVQPIPTSRDWPEVIELECRDLNTSLLHPVIPSPPPSSADATVYLRSNFEIGAWRLSRGFLNQSSWRPNARSPTLHRILDGLQIGNASFDLASSITNGRSGVNNRAFDMRTELVYQTSGIQVLDIIISNFDDGAHPFHLHGTKFWVLAGGQGYPPASWMGGIPENTGLDIVHAMRRDTVTVEAFGWVILRVVADNPGVWAFHCHISWHLEAGLMMQFWIRADEMRAWALPEANKRLCEMDGVEKGARPDDDIWFGYSG